MFNRGKKYLKAFVIKNNKSQGVIEDEIVETEPGKFKSLKFRHTHYREEDFVLTMNEVLEFLSKNFNANHK